MTRSLLKYWSSSHQLFFQGLTKSVRKRRELSCFAKKVSSFGRTSYCRLKAIWWKLRKNMITVSPHRLEGQSEAAVQIDSLSSSAASEDSNALQSAEDYSESYSSSCARFSPPNRRSAAAGSSPSASAASCGHACSAWAVSTEFRPPGWVPKGFSFALSPIICAQSSNFRVLVCAAVPFRNQKPAFSGQLCDWGSLIANFWAAFSIAAPSLVGFTYIFRVFPRWGIWLWVTRPSIKLYQIKQLRSLGCFQHLGDFKYRNLRG